MAADEHGRPMPQASYKTETYWEQYQSFFPHMRESPPPTARMKSGALGEGHRSMLIDFPARHRR